MREPVNQKIELIEDIFQKILPRPFMGPFDFAKSQIRFDLDISAEKKTIDFESSPFLKEPIEAWDFSGVKKEVTVVAPEQTGKTLCWITGLLWSFLYKPCISLVVYKSDNFAERINNQKLEPLLKMIPELAKELEAPRSHRKDHYNFTDLKSYFTGAGSRLTSVTSMVRVADELDDWEEHEGQIFALDDLRKRSRYLSESMLYKVCTVKGGGVISESPIWIEFENSSQGYWFLRCQGCGKLTIRSCDTHNLQFETQADNPYKVKKGSCRLICPSCKHEHKEKDRKKMNLQGGYIHKDKSLIKTHPGFQWGCLASNSLDFSFENIANAQLDAGSSGDIKKQILFDNSFRGLPVKTRRLKDNKYNLILQSKEIQEPIDLKYCLMSVDTQGMDRAMWYVIRGYDNKNNSYLIDAGKVMTFETLGTIWDKKFTYLGVPKMGIIDSGGHRTREVMEFIKSRPGFIAYKGRTSNAYNRWEFSKNKKRLILVNPHIFKAELLYAMYNKSKTDNHNWYLKYNTPDVYYTQLLDHKPDNKKRKGNIYKNWVSNGNDHLFDCEKMIMVLNEIYQKILKRAKK